MVGGSSGGRGIPFLPTTLRPSASGALLKGKGQFSRGLRLALLVSQVLKPRAAKRVRPRALISHQIAVSGSSRRQGLRGVASVTGRGSSHKSPHLSLHLPGLEVGIARQYRSVAGVWGQRKGGRENFGHQPPPRMEETATALV